MDRIVNYFGQEIHYEYFCKKVKNINIRVSPDGAVRVSANPKVALKEVDYIVLKRAKWILRAQENADSRGTVPIVLLHYENGDQIRLFGENYTLLVREDVAANFEIEGKIIILSLKNTDDEKQRKKVFEKGYNAFAKNTLEDAVEHMHPLFVKYDVPMPQVKIRRMKTRWGSCSPFKKIITLNLYLMQAPIACIDYVAAHELSHFVFADHSKNFYSVLANIMPDFKDRKKLLNAQNINFTHN